jgi:hypothetical protein
MKLVRQLLVPIACFLLLAGGAAALLVSSETAREVTLDSLKLVFTIVTTPFILETTVASLFLLGLLAYNRWRLQKEGDGWVYLMTQETDAAGAGKGAASKVHSMVLPNKPEPVDEELDEAGVIEGYLELGMAAQAMEEMNRAQMDSANTLEAALLHIRVLAANLETLAALELHRETSARHPAAQERLAQNAEQIVSWFHAHLPSHGPEAALWREQAGKIAVS